MKYGPYKEFKPGDVVVKIGFCHFWHKCNDKKRQCQHCVMNKNYEPLIIDGNEWCFIPKQVWDTSIPKVKYSQNEKKGGKAK